VQGTEHFRTPVEVGIKIIEGMRGHTSGLAIPTFVVDLTQGGGKVPLQPNYVLSQTKEELILRNYEGRLFNYRNPRGSSILGNGHRNGKRASSRPRWPLGDSRQLGLPIGVGDENRAVVRS
jgi:hypothetical protein